MDIPKYYSLNFVGVAFMPHKYLLAKTMLSAPITLRRTIDVKAQREGLERNELWEEFKEGIRKREHGLLSHLFNSGRNVVNSSDDYGSSVVANIRSKSSNEVYRTRLSRYGLIYANSSCNCEENFWQGARNPKIRICAHLAALDIFSNPAEALPFRIFDTNLEAKLFDVVFDYYVDEVSAFDLDKRLLDIAAIYSEDLAHRPFNFVVTPQNGLEERNDFELVYRQMFDFLKSRGFAKDENLGLEFKGCDFEAVGRRFLKPDLIYVLTHVGGVPIIIEKKLGFKRNMNLRIKDLRPDLKPQNRIGKEFEEVDDMTRLECMSRYILPGFKNKIEIEITPELRARYAEFSNNS